MNDRRLSIHFHLDSKYDQILWSATTGIWIEPNPIQIELHRMLAETVERLYRIPLDIPVRVVSGQRNEAIVEALKKEGYPVSLRTDHYFMDMIDGWNGTTGAWDLDFPGNEQEIEAFYRRAYTALQDDWLTEKRIGQMIYYPNRKIIHISNSYEMAFSRHIAKVIAEQKSGYHQFLIKTKKGFEIFNGQSIGNGG